MQRPVLIVHGIWDSERRVAPLTEGLARRGLHTVHAFTLRPNDGSAPTASLAAQVRDEVEQLRERFGTDTIDIVGFSMGALATRYYVQRLGGRGCVRRFISISGPHRGTWVAYTLPLSGVREMRPGSALLRDLEADADPWGPVEVHCIYTPLDLTIVPPSSSELPLARSIHRVVVPLHRLMLYDARVLDLTARLLCADSPLR